MGELPFEAMLLKHVKTTSAYIGAASQGNNDYSSRYPSDRGQRRSRDECLNGSRVAYAPEPLI